ncbi:hypothetical protein I204_04928 [Kwoniella mangroviensis CBS 8886]|nr:hypothetical protein I204_04928 [Kwoniella mangroviensis CBS 8886]
MQPHVPNVSSPTLATPKPSSLNLKPSIPLSYPQQEGNGISDGEVKGVEDGHDEDFTANGIDGRMTPTADSHSNPSLASSSSSNIASPNPTTISLLNLSTNPPPSSQSTTNSNGVAEVGLGSIQCEEQLKSALQSKDRMFLLVLSKEIESFIIKLHSGQIPQQQQQVQTERQVPMIQLNASTTIGVTPTSKFQRMLVYKTAEWYGMKAIPGQDGGMIVGLLGELNEKSTTLKLSELVPPVPSSSSQTQKFRIMQRAPTRTGEASGSSSPAEGSSSSSGTKWKTLEEREAAYAAAREKIYGKSLEADSNEITSEAIGTVQNEEPPTAQEDEEIDLVPRQLYQQFDVVYPSLYHPPKAEPAAAPPINSNTTANQYQSQSTNIYGYQSSYTSYPQQIDANGYPMMPQAYSSAQTIPPQQPQQNYGMMPQTYMDTSQNGYMMPQQNGYPVPVGWQQVPPQQNTAYPNPMIPVPQPYGMGPQQQNGMNVPQGWQYTQAQIMQTPQQQQQQQQNMPMISQGVPYPTSYGYSPQTAQPQPPIPQYRQESYPPLVQPTPMRPPMQPHSSASSSISSRSYQDGSRPHSRGSTTSTRSAASSVRLGAMYPASQGPGYRQRGLKGQGMNGLTSLGLGNGNASGMEHKRNRGQSPVSVSSTTTTSSRSSRRTSSIQLAPPTSFQHQLPQRPDWAANNVPYHPSPLPDPITPNAAEFPPLLRQDQGTNAEPMQVERAKIKPPVGTGLSGGSVWNGTMVKNIHHHEQQQQPPQARMTIIPPPSSTRIRTPGPVHPHQADGAGVGIGGDPDFPRRLPTKNQPVLYDPTLPRQHPNQHSRPSSVNTNKSNTNTNTMSAEEIIEAKLAQISINNGVPIGSAPTASATSSRGGDGKSYAKVVRRD